MFTCFNCHTDTEFPVWVPKLPTGAYPFCTQPRCRQAAHRRSQIAFANKPSKGVAHVRPVS